MKSVNVAKIENAEVPCQFLTFNYWNRGKKHRIYISDYKGRTLGYIDLDKEDEVKIQDRQGSTQEEIDMAVDLFVDCYLERFKSKYLAKDK